MSILYYAFKHNKSEKLNLKNGSKIKSSNLLLILFSLPNTRVFSFLFIHLFLKDAAEPAYFSYLNCKRVMKNC